MLHWRLIGVKPPKSMGYGRAWPSKDEGPGTLPGAVDDAVDSLLDNALSTQKTQAVRARTPLALPLISMTHRNWKHFPEEVFELSHVSALNHGRSEQDDK